MRYFISNPTALGLLSAYFLCGRGNPIIRDTSCKDVECAKASLALLADFNITIPELHSRAGGGGRPDRLPENSPNGYPSTHTDPNDQSGAGDQTGETEGFNNVPDTVGGMGDPEGESSGSGGGSADSDPNAQTADPNTNAQPANPVPNAQPANNPATQNANQYPPSTRNNHNQPAANANDVAKPKDAPHLAVIDVDERSKEFQSTIINKRLAGGPWYLYTGSGYEHKARMLYKDALEHKLGLGVNRKMPYMNDLLPITGDGKYRQEYDIYRIHADARNEKYYWGANSKAYGKAIDGDVYCVIPEGQSVNQPYLDRGSNWWTYELPELTRNPKVNSITVVPFNVDTGSVYIEPREAVHFGEEIRIWTRNDEPIGYPASEYHMYTRPEEPWTQLPEVPLPPNQD
jgi:hypothetical protein